MLHKILFLPVLFFPFFSGAQEFKVEYKKGADLSMYKTFQFGEGEIITPKDQRQVPDTTLHRWVRKAVEEELTKKGLLRVDSSADLTISYVAGSQARSDAGSVGPGGLTPGGSFNQNYLRDYRQGSLVIDLNDSRTSTLVWRISSSTATNVGEAQRSIDRTVVQGFKKFSIQPKKVKKNK
jgi:Domain of unknown function (DUF4136)